MPARYGSRALLHAGLVAVLALALPACAPSTRSDDRAAGSSTGPIVLIVIDTLRADRLGSYGHERDTSPVIDALARDGVRYERALSQAPWTTPSIASLLSSRYPSELGIFSYRSRLPDAVTVLPEALKGKGYATAGVVSHDFCTRRWGFAQGFDLFDESNVLGHDAIVGQGVTDRALEFLERIKDGPFFLFVHYFDPHFDYFEHADHAFRDGPPYDGPIEPGMLFRTVRKLQKRMTAADYDELRRLYDSEIAYTDAQIGRLLDGLRRNGLYEQATIVLTADHGEEFNEHGRLGHARTLYEELIHVPLIVKCGQARGDDPRCAPGRTVQHPVALIDVYPTLLDVAGIPAGDELRGVSLLSAGGDGPRPVHSETSRRRELRSVVIDRHKLIYDLKTDTAELFDTETDPTEQRDIAAESAERVAQLEQRIEAWLAATRESATDRPTLELSTEERERLEALGYVDPSK